MATPLTTSEIPAGAALSSVSCSRVIARLKLEFLRNAGSGQTYLSHSEEQPPLKVVRAFSLEDGAALVHLHNVSGGLLGGDQLLQKIMLGDGTSVQVTTTGATRVYRQRPGSLPTIQHNEFVVGKDALLEYLPDATIPFEQARFHQRTFIHLEEGSGLFWWEILSPGREARGELFRYHELEIQTRIKANDKIIAAENLRLNPAIHTVSSLSRLGPYRYLASFYVCRVGRKSSDWKIAEDYLRELTAGLTKPREILWGVSPLVAHGLVIRCLAQSGRQLSAGLLAIWRSAKRHLYDRAAIPPRKVG